MMKNKILIFSATYNEAGNIENFLDLIEELNLALDILLIDDNSPDNTWKKIQEYSNKKENIHLIIRNKKEGLDTAHKTAYEYSVKNNYDFLITLDADLSHDPKIIPEFINPSFISLAVTAALLPSPCTQTESISQGICFPE